MVTASEAAPPSEEQPKGLFGRILGSGSSQKQFKKAKMGLENKFYYNKELNCWVMPGEEEAKRKELSQTAAPPLTSQKAESEEEPRKPMQSYNASTTIKGVSSRYAPPPFGGSVTQAGSKSNPNPNPNPTSNSLLSGLRPPLSGIPFPNGSGSGPGVFNPVVFKPTVEEPAGELVSELVSNARFAEESHDEQTSTYHPTFNAVPVTTEEEKTKHDPAVIEILSFWFFYRQQGYEVDAMTEWVAENYGSSYANRHNYDDMLQDAEFKAEVDSYMRQQGAADSPLDANPDYPTPLIETSAAWALPTADGRVHHNTDQAQQVGGFFEVGEGTTMDDTVNATTGWEGFSLGPEAAGGEDGGVPQAQPQTEVFTAAPISTDEYPHAYNTVNATSGWEGFSLGPEAERWGEDGGVPQAQPQTEVFTAAPISTDEYPHAYNTVNATTGWEGFSLGPEAERWGEDGGVPQAQPQTEVFTAAPISTDEYPQSYNTVNATTGWEGWNGDQQEYQTEQNNEQNNETAGVGQGWETWPSTEPSQATATIDSQIPQPFIPIPLSSKLLTAESIGTLSSQGSLEQEKFEKELRGPNEVTQPAKVDVLTQQEEEQVEEEVEVKVKEVEVEAAVQTECVGAEEQGIQVGEGWESMVAELEARHEQAMEERIKELQAQLDTLRQEAQTEVEALQQQVEEMKKSHMSEIEDLNEVLELKNDAIRSLQEDAERREEALRAQAETLAAEQVASALADVRERIRAAVAEAIAEKDTELIRMEEELRKQAEEDVAAVEADFRSALTEKESRIEQLEEEVRAKDALATRYSQLEEELRKQAEEDVAAVEADFRSALTEKESRIEQLEEEVRANAVRLKELERTVAVAKKKIQALRNEVESKDANIQALTADLEAKSSLEEDHAALAGLLAQRDAELEILAQEASNGRAEIVRYAETLEKQEQSLRSLHDALATAEAQLSQLSSQFESAVEEERVVRRRVEAEAIRLQEQLEQAELEPKELRTQLAAASQVAASKEEELRKYKLQLVKTRKLRTVDAEKLSALESRAAEAEEGLGEALTALGQEEAKVARLSEILIELGLEPEEVDAEITAVEETVGFGREDGEEV